MIVLLTARLFPLFRASRAFQEPNSFRDCELYLLAIFSDKLVVNELDDLRAIFLLDLFDQSLPINDFILKLLTSS